MSWSRYCIISEISRTFKAVPNTNPVVYKVTSQTINVKFQANNNKLYFLVVTVSINDNIKFLENIKEGLKRTISCNKYRYKITTQTENFFFFFDYLISTTFRNINIYFAIPFENSDIDPTRGKNLLKC